MAEPLTTEYASNAEDDTHDAWIRAELARRAKNPGTLFPHDEVMADARTLIEELKARHACA